MAASVLVVDDDPDIRLTLVQVLRDEGFEVREARNGLEALEKVAEKEPDLVILDLMMPVINGWDVLATLRRARSGLPIVILSAAPHHGCKDFIGKPITYDRLLELLQTVRERIANRTARLLE